LARVYRAARRLIDPGAMDEPRYIDFISAYCDRWCERCVFTGRCSTFAAQAAMAMCGDVAEGVELAVGWPQQADAVEEPVPGWPANLPDDEPTPAESTRWRRERNARKARVDATRAMQLAWPYSLLVHKWLMAARMTPTDPAIAEALAIVAHDASLITVKLHRALDGRDLHRSGEDIDDDPAQSDFNGSAKVALLSIDRSAAAWTAIAEAIGGETPSEFAALLEELRREVEVEFPNARAFRRPGFDG
jgi:hypothetical protein